MIYNEFINTDLFKHYISSDDISFDLDRKLIYNLCKDIIMPNEKFQEFLEEKNIFWMDDFPLVNTMILKFIKNCKVKSFDKNFCFKLYSNSSDKKYSNDLANLSLRNFKKNNELINKYVSNWDVDRIAILDFMLIPVIVSLNEFIEISKDYSTEKSSFFINGILDKLVKDLLEKKSIIKEGRGLRE
jgi:N utilization substance protein B